MSRSIFITATDTGAGKTWVTANLLKHLLAQGVSAQALKPIASGVQATGVNEDVQLLMDAGNSTEQAVNFHTFQTPVAPALAGQKEACPLSPEKLLAWITQRETEKQTTLIEGVGGLMAPLVLHEQQWLVSDWLQAMPHVEVMLVIPLRLGCMSQALVHCAYLASIQRAPQWIVLNDLEHHQTGEETMRIISPYLSNIFDKMPSLAVVRQTSDLVSIL
ncbi:dethiobiotin synthase [Ghiorsea bivora]|uniref:dethiobiotin synthase n=1 Tax=Ghiorsea bivora TaxID=1485545 RepID=UPI00068B99BD|nr:dethiobiotin synthase [Ghiorsea bivora]